MAWLLFLIIILIAVINFLINVRIAGTATASCASALNQNVLTWIQGGNFIANAPTVIDSIPFWTALGSSIIVASVLSLSVVMFSTFTGYAFAKLKPRGREGLLIFVIATMAVPTQLGVVPLFIVMSRLGWTGSPCGWSKTARPPSTSTTRSCRPGLFCRSFR